MIEYIVEENDYYPMDWNKEDSIEIIRTHNREEALKAFSESSWRELYVREDEEEFSIMCNIKGIVWGYPDDMFYVPSGDIDDLSEREKTLFNEIVNELKIMNGR